MNLKNTLEEIGILEVNSQIEKYSNDKELLLEISSEIPISTKYNTKNIINNAISKIMEFKKQNIFMLSNEIAFIEELAIKREFFSSIIVGLSRNLTNEQVKNIKNNVPKNVHINYINELEFPAVIKPKDSLIIVFGYVNGTNCIITKNVYRMLEIYKSFLGKKVFINCLKENVNINQQDWISINANNYFDVII